MGLLGKVLAILNLLAAAAFIYLAAQDWSKRQQWAYAAVRFDENVQGLPLDKAEKDPNDLTPLVVLYKESTPEQLRGTAGGDVATQEDEVRRVHDQLKNEIEATPTDPASEFAADLQARNPFEQQLKFASLVLPLTLADAKDPELNRTELAGKIFNTPTPILGANGQLQNFFRKDGNLKAQKARLARVLLPLEDLGDQRDALALRIAKAKTMDELMGDDGPFEAAFKKARKSGRPGIAHLLVNLGRTNAALPEWEKRVAAVIGSQAFANEANHQAQAFKDMTARVNLATQGDLSNFVTHHRAVIEVLRTLDEKYKQRQVEFAQNQDSEARLTSLLNDRRTERDQYYKTLRDARLELQKKLNTQQQEETWLLTWEENVEQQQRANEALLQKIHNLEQMGR
jgi:hypothetical protein